jgi:hypothetical protein
MGVLTPNKQLQRVEDEVARHLGQHAAGELRRSPTLGGRSMTRWALLCLLLCASVNAQQSSTNPELTRQVAEAIRDISTVQVGMKRRDLQHVFTVEGGISARLARTYVYRRCPLIKVDIEFEEVVRDAEGRVPLPESDEDVIKRISRPYLEWSVFD